MKHVKSIYIFIYISSYIAATTVVYSFPVVTENRGVIQCAVNSARESAQNSGGQLNLEKQEAYETSIEWKLNVYGKVGTRS